MPGQVSPLQTANQSLSSNRTYLARLGVLLGMSTTEATVASHNIPLPSDLAFSLASPPNHTAARPVVQPLSSGTACARLSPAPESL